MKVSLSWLNRYLDLSGRSAKEIASILTDLGLEVEDTVAITGVDPKVVVGKILAASPHPNADSLQLCTVDVGAGDPLAIVCGAANARADIFVAAATVGAVLPGDFKIKASKIRGEKSAGMLCSAAELGLGAASDGIMELSSQAAPGTPIAKVFALQDTVFELGLTPNRADCLGHIGVARDLAAKLSLSLTETGD